MVWGWVMVTWSLSRIRTATRNRHLSFSTCYEYTLAGLVRCFSRLTCSAVSIRFIILFSVAMFCLLFVCDFGLDLCSFCCIGSRLNIAFLGRF